jgi:hypothetical protein
MTAAWAREGRKQPYVWQGLDLRKVLRWMIRLPAFEFARARLRKVPQLTIVRSSNPGNYATGKGRSGTGPWRGNKFSRGGIWLTLYQDTPLEKGLEVLLHELVHVSLPHEVSHGDQFILRLVRAAREAWGLELAEVLATPRGNHRVQAYAVDERITQEMTLDPLLLEPMRLACRADVAPPEQLPDPEQYRVRFDELRARRERHAREMLQLHERKLKAEQRLAAKWRQKVRRYERIAAKRGES